MKIGDLVQLRYHYRVEHHSIGITGLVLFVESDFYGNKGSRVTVQWLDGEKSYEPDRILEVINESR